MLHLIRDLYAHQAWADAELWRFLDVAPSAIVDKRVGELLNHIHAVQRYFLSAVQGEPLTREQLMIQMELPELVESYQKYHATAESFLAKMRESHLDDAISVPWFPSFRPKVSEALVQAVTHTVNHRGQILMLARQLGADTKPLDYIIWTSKNRPAADWSKATAATQK